MARNSVNGFLLLPLIALAIFKNRPLLSFLCLPCCTMARNSVNGFLLLFSSPPPPPPPPSEDSIFNGIVTKCKNEKKLKATAIIIKS